jgi:hypothetical protein
MRPIPKHLQHLLSIDSGTIDDELFLQARLCCPCGSTYFNLLYPGETHNGGVPCTIRISGKFYFLIEAECIDCKTKHLLFDADFHGWNGFVCHDEIKASLPRPDLTPWGCLNCNNTPHQATIIIHSSGKEGFLEQVQGGFSVEDWVEGFGSFAMDIVCVSCNKKSQTWIDYETQ